jgi:antitoxin (DNA-binding transcriptional repressor) of toxin-antitoxin stability system
LNAKGDVPPLVPLHRFSVFNSAVDKSADKFVMNWRMIWYYIEMKSVSKYGLKQELASVIAEAEAGTEILIAKHYKPAARLTLPGTKHLHAGSKFGRGRLKPAVKRKTDGRYLQILEDEGHESWVIKGG